MDMAHDIEAPPDLELGEALHLLSGVEELAAERYRGFADLVEAQARPTLLGLKADAERNVALIRASDKMLWAELSHKQSYRIRRHTTDLGRAILLHEPDRDPATDGILAYVEDSEHLTGAYYQRLGFMLPPGPLRQMLHGLRDQKWQHEQEVRRCYATLFLIW
jgi:hypothetical protein